MPSEENSEEASVPNSVIAVSRTKTIKRVILPLHESLVIVTKAEPYKLRLCFRSYRPQQRLQALQQTQGDGLKTPDELKKLQESSSFFSLKWILRSRRGSRESGRRSQHISP